MKHSTKRTLEELFFYKENQNLKEQYEILHKQKIDKKALSEASGIHDDMVLDKFLKLQLRPETLASLSLVPLIEVAWADGKVDEDEKNSVLAAAEKFGWAKGSIDYTLLKCWLDKRPEKELIETWVEYMKNLCSRLTAEEAGSYKDELMGHAKAVAEASGGFMGIGKISEAEKKIMHDLQAGFCIK
jgi:hypothetical protein